MNLSKTALAVPLVAVMLVVAAGAVLATGGNPGTERVAAPAAATPTPAPSAPAKAKAPKDDALTTVLDDLVTKGTLTDAQRKAILDGVTTERAERQAARKAAREAAREQAKADRKQLKDFLADGVITKAEFDKLPANSPMRKLTSLMDDGKITSDELKELYKGWFGGKGHGWGKGFGNGKASPSASPSTGG